MKTTSGKSIAVLVAGAALTASLIAPASAQQMRPGLWEHSSRIMDPQMQAQMAQAQSALAGMPPEQRKMMEQMMAKQGGGGMPSIGAGGTTIQKVCITKEQAARDEVGQQDPNCTQQHTRSGNKLKFRVSCTGPRPMKGEGEYTFQSDKAYSGRMRVEGGGPQGRPMEMEQSGRWLSADCGNIKPRR